MIKLKLAVVCKPTADTVNPKRLSHPYGVPCYPAAPPYNPCTPHTTIQPQNAPYKDNYLEKCGVDYLINPDPEALKFTA